jgi:hypothetical protein
MFNVPLSQSFPINPGGHLHENVVSVSVQVAAFLQGDESQGVGFFPEK